MRAAFPGFPDQRLWTPEAPSSGRLTQTGQQKPKTGTCPEHLRNIIDSGQYLKDFMCFDPCKSAEGLLHRSAF